MQPISSTSSDSALEKWIHTIFTDAIKLKTSDIHILPENKQIYIKFRIDGKFMDYKSMNIDKLELLMGKLKIISNLRMEENRLPQDGSFTISMDGREIYMRISILPTLYGEKVVLRILDPANQNISSAKLGIHEFHEKKINKYLKRKSGLILVVWPTWSGKSTTILSILKQFDPKEYNISTLEDPVEYRISGVTHSQINHRINYDFATGLRSILRQDPDVIMVGEIRDKETAKLSVEAGITGHLVLSTLHANSSANSIQRLISLDVDSNTIISGLKLVIFQQLIRKLCPECKKKYTASPEVAHGIRATIWSIVPFGDKIELYKESECGCSNCNYTWFKWRIGIFEVLEFTKSIKKLVLEKQSENLIEEQSEKDGMISMRKDGILRMVEWEISLSELESSIGEM